MTALCSSPRCRLTGQHQPGCGDDNCRGCLPNLAGAGLRLCYGCADGIGSDAAAAAKACAELAESLAPGGTGEGRGGVNPHPSLVLHEGVVAVRNQIRATIVSWAKLVYEERGATLPWEWRLRRLPDGVEGPRQRYRQGLANTTALAGYIADNARWLSAHPAAGDCADELADLVHQARRVAAPAGTRVVELGPCPMPGCGGTLHGLMRRERAALPSSITCDTDPGHEWTAADWPALAASMQVVGV